MILSPTFDPIAKLQILMTVEFLLNITREMERKGRGVGEKEGEGTYSRTF